MNDVVFLWHPAPSRKENVYILFEARLIIPASAQGVKMCHSFANSQYKLYLDGQEVVQGPARFSLANPEYDVTTLDLSSGEHRLTALVHFYGVATRWNYSALPPFFQCALYDGDDCIPLTWQCREVKAFLNVRRRINNQLGWMEFCDTRLLGDDNPADWVPAIAVESPLKGYHERSIPACQLIPVDAIPIASGTFTHTFGYTDDDPPLRFLLSTLPTSLPPDGYWYRFDCGHVGLYYPSFSVDVPAGTLIEVGYAEQLEQGYLIPFITLSDSTSCHLDRWIARGGLQTFSTFSPRGFRYLEIHIVAPEEQIHNLQVSAIQRTTAATFKGEFECSDPLLNRIWQAGAETLRACSEDALVDTPVRERGQWLGDSAMTGLETSSVLLSDLPLIRRALLQAVECKRSDGVVAGLCPGAQIGYLTSYSLYWLLACVRYSDLTGDRSILSTCYDTAQQMMQSFLSYWTSNGITGYDQVAIDGHTLWSFVDWGYKGGGTINVSNNLLFLAALSALQKWALCINRSDDALALQRPIDELSAIITTQYTNAQGVFVNAFSPFEREARHQQEGGYHATVLGLYMGMFQGEAYHNALRFIKEFIQSCFPNNLNAPRLASPTQPVQTITPSFLNFALQVLWDAGEDAFVLDQYRTCWGWMLEQGATTLLEVFDTRWSWCHVWSSCPTWQMSRYVLGLFPQRDEQGQYWVINPHTVDLSFARAAVPLTEKDGVIRVEWQRDENEFSYHLQTECPIVVSLASRLHKSCTSFFIDDQAVEPGETHRLVHKSVRFVGTLSS